jgi:hypothetical protein
MQHSAKFPKSILKPVNIMRSFIAALVFLVCFLQPARAEEVISNFTSDVTVNVDASLDVTETIVVISEGSEIKRGILRDFPTTYTDKNGVRVRVGFEVLALQRDGRDENYSIENIQNGKRIKIGNADVFLKDGAHTYKIKYRTTRQIGFFENYDELYWNVTGNGWTLPVLRASTRITLPQGAVVGQNAVYTGFQGEDERLAKVTMAAGNRFQAETTARLEARQGFTIAVAWPKGIVAAPTAADRQADWIRDNIGYFVLAASLILIPFYYFYAWFRVGRDPPKGTIVPLFRPPDGMGAAGMRYVYNAGYDDKTFAAGVVGLAVKGRMTINDDGRHYTLTKKPNQGPALTRAETALYNATPNKGILLVQSNHSQVSTMGDTLSSALDDEYDGVMYLKNFKWFAIGAALSIAGLLLAGLLMPEGQREVIVAVGLFSSVWWGIVLSAGFAAVKGALVASGIFQKIKSLLSVLVLLPFVGAGLVVPSFIFYSGEVTPGLKWFVAGAVVLMLFNVIFYWLLKAPTPRGRSVLDEIEGFRMYMTTAEEERLKMLTPPEKTPALFERYLPFAMALDCENQWNAKFASVLAAAAAAGATAGAVGGWYYGAGSRNFNGGDFSQDLGHSLTSAIASSGTAPGSSSGSSGGGFSGGGGGGGGGSGW